MSGSTAVALQPASSCITFVCVRVCAHVCVCVNLSEGREGASCGDGLRNLQLFKLKNSGYIFNPCKLKA